MQKSSFRFMSRSSSKAIYTDTSYDDESDDDSSDEDDQLAFISRKIRNMWKKRSGSNWKGSKKPHRERKDREKRSFIC